MPVQTRSMTKRNASIQEKQISKQTSRDTSDDDYFQRLFEIECKRMLSSEDIEFIKEVSKLVQSKVIFNWVDVSLRQKMKIMLDDLKKMKKYKLWDDMIIYTILYFQTMEKVIIIRRFIYPERDQLPFENYKSKFPNFINTLKIHPEINANHLNKICEEFRRFSSSIDTHTL